MNERETEREKKRERARERKREGEMGRGRTKKDRPKQPYWVR